MTTLLFFAAALASCRECLRAPRYETRMAWLVSAGLCSWAAVCMVPRRSR